MRRSPVSGCSHRRGSSRTDSRSLSRFLSRQRARPLPAPGRALFFALGPPGHSPSERRAKPEATCDGWPLVAPTLWRSRQPGPIISGMAHDLARAHLPATEADARRLGGAFALIVAFMVAEVAAGIVGS